MKVKFNAWDKTSKFMIQDYAKVGSYGELNVSQFHNSAYSDRSCPNLVLKQYSGLKDCENSEIYQDQIVYAYGNDSYYIVRLGIWKFDNVMMNGWYLERKYCMGKKYCMCDGNSEPFGSGENLRIVGNIDENSGILEGSEILGDWGLFGVSSGYLEDLKNEYLERVDK